MERIAMKSRNDFLIEYEKKAFMSNKKAYQDMEFIQILKEVWLQMLLRFLSNSPFVYFYHIPMNSLVATL